ncbi:ABC transporter permease [Streptomyces armeniacus]|uniref:ABC transporter permease n=1 Tax=Streptomyces armeniacus TaxID=83291 RepID=A0A345XNA1_9ACTN|nr:FtsX-like permease family protein [Streptomyces armeniacus]AXK33117.1 ABC transporter permease [Streptomyces armeniacus]
MTVRATLRWAHADLRANRGQALFSVLATAGIIASLLLAAALFSYATNPWERIFTQTRGAHVWLSTSAGAEMAGLSRLDGVTGVSGPFRTTRTTAESGGVRAVLEMRAADAGEPPEVARPQLVSGHWLEDAGPGGRPDVVQGDGVRGDGVHGEGARGAESTARDGIVLEESLAEAMWAEPGDTLTVPGSDGPRRLEVVGVAETAEPHYSPGEQPGVGWVLPGTLDSTERKGPGQTIGLRLDDPRDTDFVVQRAVTELGSDQVAEVTKWQEARADAEGGYRLLGLVFGVFGLGALLAGALVASGAISTRVRGQLRDISMLKAIGFTPAQLVGSFLIQHLAMAVLAVALGTGTIMALGPHIPGQIGEAAAVWQELPGHFTLLFGLPAAAVLLIALTTGLAAWRAGRVPPVPSVRAALPSVGPMSRVTRRALSLAGSSTLLLGWRSAFPRRARALTAVLRLAVPLVLITVALSVWATMDRFQSHPEEVGLPAALTARSAHAGQLGEQENRRMLAAHPDVSAVHPSTEVDALVPGQTGTITLRGVGTEADPYPFALAEGRRPNGPDEAVAGEGLLKLLQADVGDWVRMTVEGRPQILHIVGRNLEPAEGGRVISTTLDALRERDPGLRQDHSLLELRPGADPHAVSAELGDRVTGGLEIAEVPNPADGLTPARWGIAGMIAVLALIVVTELLTAIGACVRDRGRDLLALRAIGLTPRQISTVVVASTGFLTLAAAVAGTGTGVLLSGWLIDTQGSLSGIGAGIAQLPSPWTLTALGASAVVGAVAASLLPAARVSRRRLADSLSETL